MSQFLPARGKQASERSMAALRQGKANLLARRAYYSSVGFERALRDGEPLEFQSSISRETVSGFLTARSIGQLEDSARGLPVYNRGRGFGLPDLNIGYFGSRRWRYLLEGAASIRDLGPDNLLITGLDLCILGVDDGIYSLPSSPPPDGTRDITATHALRRACERAGVPLVLLTNRLGKEHLHSLAGLAAVFTLDEQTAHAAAERAGRSVIVELARPFFSPLVHSPVGRQRHRVSGGLFAGEFPHPTQGGRRTAFLNLIEGFDQADVPLVLTDPGLFSDNRPTLSVPWQYARHLSRPPQLELLPRFRRIFDYHVIANLQHTRGWSFPLETVPALASTSLVLATYSVGMNNELPSVLLPHDVEDVYLQLHALAREPHALYEQQLNGARQAFERFTADRLLVHIARSLGIAAQLPKLTFGISSETDLDAPAFLASQKLPDLVTHVPNPRDADFVVDLRSDTTYGPHFVSDILNAFRMSGATEVTINRSDTKSDQDFEFVPSEDAGTADARWGTARGDARSSPRHETHGDVFLMGGTSARDRGRERVMLRAPTTEPLLTVVVPVYNNGRHLRSRCFESLRRSSAFQQMHVLLVDDGSSDIETRFTVSELANSFPNVTAHFLEGGASGSASRPRNEGLRSTNTPYVTYLDPDNEATGDGYARLLQKIEATGADFAIGNMVRFAKRRTLIDNVAVLQKAVSPDADGTITVQPDTIEKIDFQPMSIQALIARTKWLQSTGIQQPVGALGQDSLFFQMMLHEAKHVALVKEPIHSYYGEVAGSMVNTVGPSFFRKYIPLEATRVAWLKRTDLFDSYRERRALPFFRVWFWPRFNDRVHPDEKDECFTILRRIVSLYDVDISLSSDGQSIVESSVS